MKVENFFIRQKMKQKIKIVLGILFLVLPYQLLWGSNHPAPPIKVALVSDFMPEQELGKIVELLKSFDDISCSVISAKELENISNGKFTHVWIHKTAVQEPGNDEINCKKSILSFLNNGGNVFLSREALFLLNTWGIEQQPLQVEVDTVRDEGFGRPLGFHAFKSHPLFDGLNGGAYPCKATQDHVSRKIGFFGDVVPVSGKVAGIEWRYITFLENNKLLLEYQVGKGKIIAAGAFLDYSIPNFNTLQLTRFTHNVFRYTSGELNQVKKYFWEYSPQVIKEVSVKTAPLPPMDAEKWEIPELSAELGREKATNNFVNLAGRRILIMGREKGGIEEIWAHPFMALRDYMVEVVLKNNPEVIRLNRQAPKITVSPEMIIREYKIGNAELREIITSSFDKPIVVMHYEWTGSEISKIILKQTSNLRYMWPYSEKTTGAIEYAWLPEVNAMLASGSNGELNALTSFSSVPSDYIIGQNDSANYQPDGNLKSYKTDKIQVNSAFVFDAETIPSHSLNVGFVAGVEGKQETLDLFKGERENVNQLFLETNEFYTSLLKNYLVIESPDPVFNDSYKWALLRMNQFVQETPGIGTSLMAGYATTASGWGGNQKISGRPGYAWYFGRDGEWSGMALDASGNFEMVKNVLQVYNNFMDVNGKIFHELTSSGIAHYDASDASPLYLALAAHYLKHSGGLDFIKTIWPGLKKTFSYIRSTDTDGDGLIENTNVGHGWTEGGKLFGSHTEIHLAGCQVAAAEAMEYLATAMGDKNLAAQSKQFAEKTKQIIGRDFWNPAGKYFYQGKMKDGSYMDDNTTLAAACIYLNAVDDPEKAFEVASGYAGNDFTSDWGTRIISEFNPKTYPASYHEGNVWPLFTGWASLAEYYAGCYTSGFLHFRQTANTYNDWALGCIAEALRGKNYNPSGVCPLQCWSETMIIQPAIEGMLGLKADALQNKLELAPRFPWDWENVHVANIRMNKTRVNMEMDKSETGTSYLLTNKGEAANIRFSPAFPLLTRILSVEINGKSVSYKIISQPESISVLVEGFVLKEGENKVVIRHQGGKAVLPPVVHPEPGQETSGVKILSQEADGSELKAILNGLPGKTYQVSIFSPEQIEVLSGGKIISRKGIATTVELIMPLSDKKYVNSELIIK